MMSSRIRGSSAVWSGATDAAVTQRGFVLVFAVADADGEVRTLRDLLNGSAMGATKLRQACKAIHALACYEGGNVATAAFIGQRCRLLIGIKKQRGYGDQNVIEDYAASGGLGDQSA
jgi:hypothetical protein